MKSKGRMIGHVLVVTGAALGVSARAGAQWSVIDLHPSEAAKSSASGAVAGMQGGSVLISGSGNRAVIWSGTSAYTNLHPYANGSSLVMGVWRDGSQVGVASHGDVSDDGTSSGLALPSLWRGTSSSWVNLRPAHATSGVATCAWGAQQGGFSFYASPHLNLTGQHASLWSGSAGSHVDLHPKDSSGNWLVLNSGLSGIAHGQQVGATVAAPAEPTHAALWRGSGTTWVDLHPSGASESGARGVGAGTQAGWAAFGAARHAGLWRGSASSWTDLHPAGADESMARSVFGGWQVGYASFRGDKHAGLWAGSAGSWHDLDMYLGPAFQGSNAASVWGEGPLLIVAGVGLLASDPSVGHAIVWVRCRIDVDMNGFVNGDDYDVFGSAFDNAEVEADFNGDGFVNGDDWDEFIVAFEQGCD